MTKHGFSLLELAVVITILSVVISGGLTLTTAKIEQDHIRTTWQEMERIEQALNIYVHENQALPCPAPIDAKRNEADFGRIPATCDGSDSGHTRHAAPGGGAIIGGVPFYALGLPDEYLADDWNGRYTYAVSENLLTTANSAEKGILIITDEFGNNITNEAGYVIISHGQSKEGAYTAKTGTLGILCKSGALDNQNCGSSLNFIDALYNDGDNIARFFDDFVKWSTVPNMFGNGGANGLPSCANQQTLIYNGALSQWECIDSSSLGNQSALRRGPFENCLGAMAIGHTEYGVYTIDPDGDGTGVDPYQAYCDLTTDGGGWTLVDNLTATSSGLTSRTVGANTSLSTSRGAYLPGYKWSDTPQLMVKSNYYNGTKGWVTFNALNNTAKEYPTKTTRTGNYTGSWSVAQLNGNTNHGTGAWIYNGSGRFGTVWIGSGSAPTAACSYVGTSTGLGQRNISVLTDTCSTWVR